MGVAFVGLGSSLDNRIDYLVQALRSLNQTTDTRIAALSSVYETAPLGGVAESKFLNLVCRLETGLTPYELFSRLKSIERLVGRRPRARWDEREIDLDLLLFDDRVVFDEDLEIPHPGLIKRDFVLLPLLEISADLLHPVTKQPLAEAAKNLETFFILGLYQEQLIVQNDEVILIHG